MDFSSRFEVVGGDRARDSEVQLYHGNNMIFAPPGLAERINIYTFPLKTEFKKETGFHSIPFSIVTIVLVSLLLQMLHSQCLCRIRYFLDCHQMEELSECLFVDRFNEVNDILHRLPLLHDVSFSCQSLCVLY